MPGLSAKVSVVAVSGGLPVDVESVLALPDGLALLAVPGGDAAVPGGGPIAASVPGRWDAISKATLSTATIAAPRATAAIPTGPRRNRPLATAGDSSPWSMTGRVSVWEAPGIARASGPPAVSLSALAASRSRTSVAVAGRSAGFLASKRAINTSRSVGVVGRTDATG